MTKHIQIVVDAEGIALITLDVAGRSVNVFTPEFTRELRNIVDAVTNRSDIVGAVVTSGKPAGFMAGADLLDFVNVHDRGLSPREAAGIVAEAAATLRLLERCGKPVAAAINGFALGGGFELCLACHYRVLLDEPKAVVGLPEVTVGLLPAGGGTQRLPRLLGIAKALPLLLSGRHVGGSEALELGLVDALVSVNDLLPTARSWVLAHPGHVQVWDRKGFTIPGGAGALASHANESFGVGMARIRRDTQDNEPAPVAILASVYEGTLLPIDRGLAIESAYFGQLLAGPVARNLMRTMFIHSGSARRLARRPQGFPKQPVRRLGVLGEGPLATTIAVWAANVGIDVVSLDVGNPNVNYQELRGCDFIVDALIDDLQLKTSIRQLAVEAIGPLESVVWASADVQQTLTEQATKWHQPEALIGIHLPTPEASATLVEVVQHATTSQQTLSRAFDFIAQLKKLPIVVCDGPGASYIGRLSRACSEERKVMQAEGVMPALIQNAARQAGFLNLPLSNAFEGDSVPPAKVQPSLADVKNRLLYATALESVRCFEAGIVTDPADADLGAVFALGYPKWTGGTLSFIEAVSLKGFVDECDRLAGLYGDRFRPSKGLRDKATTGQKFYPAT
jgi:3-hydroxyacyl-CoA dehydrogenase/enoyl-CoA hydratase/3-hydroxybutyryl-CoA epimerase